MHIQEFFFNALNHKDQILINLCELQSGQEELMNLLQNIKGALVDPDRLDYFGTTTSTSTGNVRHLELIPTRNRVAA